MAPTEHLSANQIAFTEGELRWLSSSTHVLRWLADRYEVDICEADAMAGEFEDIQAMIKRHEDRIAQIEVRIKEIGDGE